MWQAVDRLVDILCAVCDEAPFVPLGLDPSTQSTVCERLGFVDGWVPDDDECDFPLSCFFASEKTADGGLSSVGGSHFTGEAVDGRSFGGCPPPRGAVAADWRSGILNFDALFFGVDDGNNCLLSAGPCSLERTTERGDEAA